MDLRMKCPFAILLTKNLNHQNTHWNTCHPALASINCSTESVIPWSFWAWNPLNPGRRILFDNASREHPQQDAENEVKKSTPQAILQEIYQSSPCREDKQTRVRCFFFGGGATSSKNLSDPKRPFLNVLYRILCCNWFMWSYMLDLTSWASYDQPYEFSQPTYRILTRVSMFWSLFCM